jgi:hypothetical protein
MQLAIGSTAQLFAPCQQASRYTLVPWRSRPTSDQKGSLSSGIAWVSQHEHQLISFFFFLLLNIPLSEWIVLLGHPQVLKIMK